MLCEDKINYLKKHQEIALYDSLSLSFYKFYKFVLINYRIYRIIIEK
jgi:hypothetical protein